jgi:hypothetical protein
VRLFKSSLICSAAPQFAAEGLLRAEGFKEIAYVEVPRTRVPQAFSDGRVDFTVTFAVNHIQAIDGGAQLGAGQPSTILGGVEELVTARQYPLAALVFFASIAVPMLKLFGLSIMLITIQTGRSGWLRDAPGSMRFIGRWSMIDIFMESLLGALVAFGSVITIEPGAGTLALAVVILTIFAAETFDPRLMRDVAAPREPTATDPNPGLTAGD